MGFKALIGWARLELQRGQRQYLAGINPMGIGRANHLAIHLGDFGPALPIAQFSPGN